MNMKIPILHYIIMREAFYSIDRETCEWDSFVVAVRHGWTLGEGESSGYLQVVREGCEMHRHRAGELACYT